MYWRKNSDKSYEDNLKKKWNVHKNKIRKSDFVISSIHMNINLDQDKQPK